MQNGSNFASLNLFLEQISERTDPLAYYVIQVNVYLVGGELHYFSRSGILQFDWLIVPKFTLRKFSTILSSDSHVLQADPLAL